jgi:hypothetical protein
MSVDRDGLDVRLLRDVIARVIAAREELEVGDSGTASTILFDLEIDLVAVLERGERRE